MPDLPKFLSCSDLDLSRDFVLHTEYPRFLAEVLDGPDGPPLLQTFWIDPADELTPEQLQPILAAAGAFYQASLEVPGHNN